MTFSIDSEVNGAGAFNAAETPDGTTTLTSTGQTLLFLHPSDTGGPATTLYTGGLVVRVDSGGNFSVVSYAGKAVDVCALLGR